MTPYFVSALGSAAALYLMFERPINAVVRRIASDRNTNFGPLVVMFTLFGLAPGALVVLLGYGFLGNLLLASVLMFTIAGVRQMIDPNR